MKPNKKIKKVALLVLNYNCRPFIGGCLDSLLQQSYKNKVIFFIDNNSTDGSALYVKKNYPQIKLVRHAKNLGIGRGFNTLIKKIIPLYDYIALFNTDVRVDQNWLKELILTFEQDCAIEVCSGLTLNWQGNLIENAGGTIINFLTGIIGGFLGNQNIRSLPPKYRNKAYPTFFSIITGMLVKTSAFKNKGFFDESYFMFCEDFDFCWRVLLSGGKVICNPKAIMYHSAHYVKRNKKIIPKILKLTETNLLATYYKNLSIIGLFTIFPILVVMRFLMAMFYIFIAPYIAILKIKGICLFFKNLFSGRYRQNRSINSKIRLLSDQQVLSFNPTNIFNIKTIFDLSPSWFKTIHQDIILKKD